MLSFLHLEVYIFFPFNLILKRKSNRWERLERTKNLDQFGNILTFQFQSEMYFRLIEILNNSGK